ncbi:hypothetical protein [Halorhabdus salina]|uniref:hypothetical protein n=1 Tax=Halorhabdus salina TaxID=2750670 RepID=UPI0015EF5A2B|nr:hypothetical protein [Halorhabdus salina]
MYIRDAVEADADALARVGESPVDVMRNLIHDRTVRIASVHERDAGEARSTASDGTAAGHSNEPADNARVVGFVSFDVRGETVYVTQIGGTEAACTRLLDEPVGFARREDMDVELLVAENEPIVRRAVEASAFTAAGDGPRFLGRSTTRYRLNPDG